MLANEIFLTSKEAAEYLRIKEMTLREWRFSKRYKLPFYKVGSKKVLYKKIDLDGFIKVNGEITDGK
jgi:excisionase family DNA binding protein